MIEFKNTIVINRPLPEVFQFVSEFENLPKWNYYVLEVNKLKDGEDGPGTKGTTYHQVRKGDDQQFRVAEYIPNEFVMIETLPPERALSMSFWFESTEGATQITDEWKVEPDIPAPFAWLAGRQIKSAVSENLRKLKELLETGEVELQDGRQVMIEDFRQAAE